ncbi:MULTISPECIES: ABC transporter substrate-binding protein [unclassified Mesorhizobium]|uniref:ABC transporter substrate-binding protein n=1 Tax=unclassified Mesorhizobium TaxID=325217 RepID=UPI0010936798|nr:MULTISPECIES: ABC transporter substrate-binding protein [unclassified Mesorhizobium]TGQ77267.1 ABC transporter substrate-binding protein [Mesorhizobium sp. M8A.F.Ca.ET.207.01.1.1]TGS39020.1 ABC transporter substrate-binding protein [Mesorhizobium sp. M8A.F.Ca.ET.182.01.1.1]TGS77301.1 ABC transporter substrate-binding protein [Mesorhizobium sp. M8A.F.Ca.ET.181.01.1.1]TGT36317.1 ABC transporter substrate-binding protein [Mesorhizobium sp. M8A.F.Ca.ET.165.01.1.1]
MKKQQEAVGWNISRRHAMMLALGALAPLSIVDSLISQAHAAGKTEIKLAIGDAQVKETLDPALSEITNSHVVVGVVYDHLVRYDATYKLTPHLAERWEPNSDATEWTFYLRKDVKWHDGRPFTAADVEYTIRRLIDKNVGSDLFARLAPSIDPKRIVVKNDHEISIGLLRPDAFLPLTFGTRQSAIVPTGFETRTTDLSKAIGCGPFKLVSYSPGKGWEAVRNDEYYGGASKIERIRVSVIPEQATKLQAVVAGDFDACDAIQPSLARTIEGNSKVKLARLTADRMMCIAMDSTQKPFNDPRVQMAIKRAIDRKKLLDLSYLGYGEVSNDIPVPPTDPLYPSDVDHSQDIELSKRLLAEAGYPNGIDIELGTSESFGGMVDLAVAFAGIVAPAGIRVTVKQHPPSTYWDQVWLHGAMYVTYWTTRHAADRLPITYGEDSHVNESRFKSPKLHDLVAGALATLDEAKQKSLFQEALRLVAEESGLIVPFFIDKLWVAQSAFDLRVSLETQVDLANSSFS